MGFVSDMENRRKGGEAPKVNRDNLPKNKVVLPADFPTMVSEAPLPPKHVEGKEENPPRESALEGGDQSEEQRSIQEEEEHEEKIETASGTKVSVTIRLDEEIVVFFKRTGRGWQTRINAVLLEHVKAS